MENFHQKATPIKTKYVQFINKNTYADNIKICDDNKEIGILCEKNFYHIILVRLKIYGRHRTQNTLRPNTIDRR